MRGRREKKSLCQNSVNDGSRVSQKFFPPRYETTFLCGCVHIPHLGMYVNRNDKTKEGSKKGRSGLKKKCLFVKGSYRSAIAKNAFSNRLYCKSRLKSFNFDAVSFSCRMHFQKAILFSLFVYYVKKYVLENKREHIESSSLEKSGWGVCVNADDLELYPRQLRTLCQGSNLSNRV